MAAHAIFFQAKPMQTARFFRLYHPYWKQE